MEEIVFLEKRGGLDKVSIHENENRKILEIDGHLFDYIDLLNSASKISYHSEFDVSQKLLLVDLAMSIAPRNKELGFIEQAIRQLIITNYIDSKPNEFAIHELAKQKITKIIIGSKVIENKNDPKHQPDLWIEKESKKIPIEVKLKDFNSKSLKQLERYMSFYECDQGIAVAESLTTELPANIQFISIKDLKKEATQ